MNPKHDCFQELGLQCSYNDQSFPQIRERIWGDFFPQLEIFLHLQIIILMSTTQSKFKDITYFKNLTSLSYTDTILTRNNL